MSKFKIEPSHVFSKGSYSHAKHHLLRIYCSRPIERYKYWRNDRDLYAERTRTYRLFLMYLKGHKFTQISGRLGVSRSYSRDLYLRQLTKMKKFIEQIDFVVGSVTPKKDFVGARNKAALEKIIVQEQTRLRRLQRREDEWRDLRNRLATEYEAIYGK